MVVDLAAIEVLLGTIDADTGSLAVVGGGAEATALRVTIANDSTGVVTVDGTVTANLSATDNAVLDAMVVDLAALEVDLAAIEVLLGTIDADTSNITACNTGAVVVASGAITETNSASLAVVGGGAEATALRVTLANDSTGVILSLIHI